MYHQKKKQLNVTATAEFEYRIHTPQLWVESLQLELFLLNIFQSSYFNM